MLIENCSCGKDHEEMPMIDIGSCDCLPWDESTWIEGCTHNEFLVPAVCITHKRHEPCRPCFAEIWALERETFREVDNGDFSI